MIPARISVALDAVVERLRDTPRIKRPQPAEVRAYGCAWLPEAEGEEEALALELKGGLGAIAAARHAIAVARGDWPRRIEARVLVRDADWNAHAFNVRFIGNSQQIEKVRCCHVCGCTEDRACKGGCAWARANLCTACAHG